VPFSVLIIGAGNIGAFFDTPESGAVLSHAHAFSVHQGFALSGFVDADFAKAERAANLWGGKAFQSVKDAANSGAIDVVVVAVPDDHHFPILMELARYPVKLVFAEKPLTKTVDQALEINQLYRTNGISLAVNYSRRFVPEMAALSRQIASGSFGRYLTGTGYYGKGTLHNGSHLIDLVRFLVGNIKDVNVVSCNRDFYEDDPSCSAVLVLDDGALFFMQAVDCRCYTLFELDLLFERQRIRVTDSGFRIELQEVRGSARFAGYRTMEVSDGFDTQLDQALYAAAANIHDHLAAGVPLLCDGVDGYKAIAICNDLIQALL
jgi:predicted dehydrogenase